MKMATEKYIPYGRQQVDEADIAAVVEVLRSDWLTTGPKVAEFEGAIADYVGCRYAVAVSSGTAALHAAVAAIGVGPGDEVVLPPLTFVATANAVLYQGATPVFADVDAATLLLDPEQVEAKITPRTKAIIAVDYAGQPCDYEALSDIAERHQLRLLDDASHSLGAKWQGRKVGSLADLSTFSFHPVKSITCGEGGMVTTDDLQLAQWLRQFRNHGIDVDHRQRAANGTWHYQMCNLGFNYRLSDLHCSLGVSQLGKLPGWISRRQEIAAEYNRCFADHAGIEPLVGNADTS
ncbi:MAG: DegT/DnrJ/EryC1/StrS family aminotransferase, partial [Anaerolineales bacterium]|nr:DegT/DnrJ/EryC1/StrS family aminotransferase [Anaerolineales bacterium]